MALAIVGFGVTIAQVKRVKSAVAERAAQTAGEMLLLSVGQLERIEREFRSAANLTDHGAARRALYDWRASAGQVRVLSAEAADSRELQQSLVLSLGMVPTVLDQIDAGEPDLRRLAGSLLTQMSGAVDAARSLGVLMMTRKED